jgi:hypothetical protein
MMVKRFSFIALILLLAGLLSACHVATEAEAQEPRLTTLFKGKIQEVNESVGASLGASALTAKLLPVLPKVDPKTADFSPSNPAPYWTQAVTPAYLSNFAHPEAGCSWLGVAGQVFDEQGETVGGKIVNVGGTLAGAPVSLAGVTGSTQMYGPQSYEIVISKQPVESHNTVWVQLSDLTGKALSDRVAIDTSTDCEKNLVIVNFQEVLAPKAYYFPWVGNEPTVDNAPAVENGTGE